MRRFNKTAKVVILLGPPGAGKGTQAELLSERFGLIYVETSKILEEEFRKAKKGDFITIQEEKYSLAEQEKLWKSGILCDPPFVTALLQAKFRELWQQGRGLVLAGSPRTLYEVEREIPLLEELYGKAHIHVFLIEVREEESIWRNSNRRICELLRHPVLFNEETERLTQCPLDGSKIVKRKGLDDPETIKVRLREYRERTLPIVEYLERSAIEVKRVDGDKTVEEIFLALVRILQEHDSH